MLNLDVYQKYNSLRRRGVPPQLKDLHLLLICFGTNSEEQQSAGFARDVCTKFARFNAQARDVNDFKKACQDSALSAQYSVPVRLCRKESRPAGSSTA